MDGRAEQKWRERKLQWKLGEWYDDHLVIYFVVLFLMGCRKENWLTVVVSMHEGVAKEGWHVVLYLPKLRSQAEGRYSKRNDWRVFLLVSRARVRSGTGNHTDHSFMCSCPRQQYSMSKSNPVFFPLSMIVFHFINKRFLSNEIRILYSSCLDAGWSHRMKI